MLHSQVFRTVRIPVGGKIHKQAGFASILLILFIGLALTTLIIGMVTSVRGLQGSSLTAHAQTQAQIKSAIGYQALSGLLSTLSATQIATINNGTIKRGTTDIATYTVTTDCPTSTASQTYSCYNIKAISGGASSIVRAIYATKTTGSGAFTGSVFAGGLRVGQTRNLQGENQTIQVGGGVVRGNGTNTYYTNAEILANNHLAITAYVPTTFVTAEELRSYANYIFYANGTCAINNLYINTTSPLISRRITAEESVACSNILQGITSSGSGASKTWTINAGATSLRAGVLWFEGTVTVNLNSSGDLVNTVIATGPISVETDNQGGAGRAYAPNHYNLATQPTEAQKKSGICGLKTVSSLVSTGIPTQYCEDNGTRKSMDTELAKVANILFLSNSDVTFNVKNNSPMSLYGNIVGTGGSGGTGAASGKFAGQGKIDITGNLVFNGSGTIEEPSITETNGDLTVNLKQGNINGNAAPSKKVMSLSSLRYM